MTSNSKTASERKLHLEDDIVSEPWKILRQRIDQISVKLFFIPAKYHMDLYGLIYECCTSTFPPPKNPRINAENDAVWFRSRSMLEKLRNIIYHFLDQYVIQVKNMVVALSGQNIFEFYCNRWDDYQVLSKELVEISNFSNKHWIKAGEFQMRFYLSIPQMTVGIWKTHIMPILYWHLTFPILQLINEERNGKAISNTKLISRFVQSLIEYYPYGDHKEDPSLYKEMMENSLLEETKKFYVKESNQFLSRNSFPAYLKKVDERLLEEEKRVKTYLHESTLDLLLQTCQKVLIEKHLETFIAHYRICMKENKTDDLNRVFQLAKRIPKCLDELLSIFESHVYEKGISAIENCGEAVSNDPKTYVETISRVRNEELSKVATAFDDYPDFLHAMDKGCCKFINNNLVTQMENSKRASSSELLASYCDLLQQKISNDLNAAEIEHYIENVITVFRYIDDKDVFQTLYSKLLAKRLIFQSSSSNDAVETMIGKLKFTLGNGYTYKLQRMLNDAKISRDLNDKFRDLFLIADDSTDFDFDVRVLSCGVWPFPQSCSVLLPVELEKKLQRFTAFYNWLYSGRKLQWHYQLSRGELVTNCFQKRHTLLVSNLQMVILLQFNASDRFTVQELQENTQIPVEYVTQVLQILIKAELLISDTIDTKENNLQPTSTVRLFLRYKNVRRRVNLNGPMKVEMKRDKEATDKAVEIKRKILIQAAIVRVMKTKNQLKHQQLLGEIFQQLSDQFVPTVSLIKKCIDILIEKDYLKRDETQSDVYIYLA